MKEIDVDFTCPNCQHQFNLSPGEVLAREMVWCPKCQYSLSEEELNDLKIAINYLNSLN